MSQFAHRIVTVTDGNNARVLSVAEPQRPVGPPSEQERPAKARTPLSLVTSVPRRSRRSLVITLFLLIGLALAAVLAMSVSVSQGQYELVGLKGQQSTLAMQNQALQLDLSAKEAPQSLVAAAAKMGMVPAVSTGQIDVRTHKVTGNPQPAPADTKGLVAIPPADVNKPAPNAYVEPAPAAADAGSPALNGGTIPAPAQKDR